jgi:ribosomal protein L24
MQITNVDKRIEEDRRWKRADIELYAGQAVRVSGGDYQGMFGVVVRTTKDKAVVLIEGSKKEQILAKRNVEGIEWII